ncbi:serine palmitoyltransferase [Plasmopara halstedii]|uniref:serine C-palmitoyltransferase n=1 Tax=Plasmopara halstedii TaxID=4781 RepID=A0A0P1B470_PLAHL|nr:serine palmitoyltransferase [Plasmopara halstedii]CEG48930.1 serine palmitoyltransferase [Plasmopara halstedii]|eukprot:XP_024585299.1 serine palmitoyltransferase [Plasmopara halstedii]
MGAEHVPWLPALMCFLQYSILITFGHLRDIAARISGISRYHSDKTRSGLAKLLIAWESFYTRRLYHRVQDVFNRPVASAPGAHIDLIKRESIDENKTFVHLNEPPQHCLNFGSYNYLGFADDWMHTCSREVFAAIDQFALASTVPPMEFGTTSVHIALEKAVAKFIGKEAAIVYNMGYATNATSIPALMGKGTLILSDALNHTSIVNGARASGATVGVFRHNDPKHLEKVLRLKIAEGQPRTHRAWKKVMVMVEGIYSMEGEIVRLREIVDVSKKYKAYIYVDEAHSIGALGRNGRGICEYAGVDPSEVDILMGTFTKSFGGMGGYIAASKEIIYFIRSSSAGAVYATSLSPIIAQQILTALNIIAGFDGTDTGRKKLDSLRENSNYFRQKLINMGVIALGDFDSPVIPVMLYHMSKVGEYSRECLKRNLAVVTVGFPATPLLLSRVRFCVSAAHTKQDMDEALKIIAEVSEICHVRYRNYTCG